MPNSEGSILLPRKTHWFFIGKSNVTRSLYALTAPKSDLSAKIHVSLLHSSEVLEFFSPYNNTYRK